MRKLFIAILALSTWLPLIAQQSLGAGASSFTGTLAASNINNPAAPSLSDLRGNGTLNANTQYSYQITATTSAGETSPSVVTVITTIDNASNTHAIFVAWNPILGATGYKVYGRVPTRTLCKTITDATVTSWVDNGSASCSGASPIYNNT